jgi:23S rRNA U2552 (ribose-2'-O)-methylase RlmE/FtsJ
MDSILSFSLSSSETCVEDFDIQVFETDLPEQPCESFGYDYRLNKFRNYIDNVKSEDWKKVRWYINKYDFLVKDPIINRAFYKYWEIINEFEIFETYKDTDIILHCAEAPGGFIQGSNIYLQIDTWDKLQKPEHITKDKDGFMTVINRKKKKNKKDYKIYTISLNKDLPQYKTYNLPSYNKNVINKYVCVTYGKDNTGDINNWENLDYIKYLSNNLFFLITADGGFDEGTDFNNKEQLHYGLILSEIYGAIRLQQKDGHFILKVFDVFTQTSVHLLYLLSLCYKEVIIYKPKTSRPTNSEKYVVCKYFQLAEINREKILKNLLYLSNQLRNNKSKYISFSLFSCIPTSFLQQIFDMNKSLLNKQCNALEQAVQLCNPTFIQKYDDILESSIENRKTIFKNWEDYYNLISYV